MLPRCLGGITTMLILSFGGLKVMDGSMTIGMLLAFQILMSRFQGPVNNLVDLGQTMQQMRGDLARLDDVLAHQPDPIDGEEALVDTAEFGAQQRVKLSGLLELKGITFGYNPSAEPLLEDFDLTLKPGARVALVGGSGSGKSTIAKLASGLYQPWSGEILFDGKPRSKLPPDLINNSLAMVDQDVLLFAGTVRDNLTLWDETLPDEALVQACQDAEILERVQALAGGLDAVLDEGGGNLSGGERQRLEIARSLVCNPSILVLDEATSALDTESEHLIVDRISLRGCSCLIVAHRLSTIRDCDEIIVLEQGKVVERGTHEELWRRRGAYARLLELDESMSGASA
jgi:ATP-binding cassette subfamily C protein